MKAWSTLNVPFHKTQEKQNISKPLHVSDASQIGAKLRIAVKLVHCSHLANGIWMGQNLITTSVNAAIWFIIWFKTDLWWHKVHLICFTTAWSTFKGREVLGASDGHPLRWNWKGCKYFGEVQIKRNWTSPDGAGCHQRWRGRGGGQKLGLIRRYHSWGSQRSAKGKTGGSEQGASHHRTALPFIFLESSSTISFKSVWVKFLCELWSYNWRF